VTDETSVGIWGAGRWTAAGRGGAGNPQRRFLTVDRYDGTGYWARHCWITDFWLRW
jgi:hypothetical protein